MLTAQGPALVVLVQALALVLALVPALWKRRLRLRPPLEGRID